MAALIDLSMMKTDIRYEQISHPLLLQEVQEVQQKCAAYLHANKHSMRNEQNFQHKEMGTGTRDSSFVFLKSGVINQAWQSAIDKEKCEGLRLLSLTIRLMKSLSSCNLFITLLELLSSITSSYLS